jgi:hypothetical protein
MENSVRSEQPHCRRRPLTLGVSHLPGIYFVGKKSNSKLGLSRESVNRQHSKHTADTRVH